MIFEKSPNLIVWTLFLKITIMNRECTDGEQSFFCLPIYFKRQAYANDVGIHYQIYHTNFQQSYHKNITHKKAQTILPGP